MWKAGNLEGKNHAFTSVRIIIYISAWRLIYIFNFLWQNSDFCEVEWAHWGENISWEGVNWTFSSFKST